MIGRTFIDLPEEIKLTDAVKKFKSLGGTKFISERKNTFVITSVKTGDVRDFFADSNGVSERNFVPIIISISVDLEEKVPEINETRTDINIKKQKHEVPIHLYFWLFKDKIILSRVSDSRNYLLPILDNIFSKKIEIPYYDVNRIYSDYRGKKGVHAYGFLGRKDSARSGSLYFPNGIDEYDVVFQETDKVSKSFVSLAGVLDDVDFTVYGSGAIVIRKDWYSMADYLGKLMEIRDFLRKYEVHGN